MKLDYEFYLSKQLLPPIDRLCAPIEGTDASRIADCLGLDSRKYDVIDISANPMNDLQPLESELSDQERFRSCSAMKLSCTKCSYVLEFRGIADSKVR